MSKNTIGVIPLWDASKNSIWMLPGYLDGILDAGGLPIILPLTTSDELIEQLLMQCDGFLITGGHDISPKLYNATSSDKCGEICETRDIMENKLLHIALKLNKPILGICRGIQILNAFLGGTLYQDIPTEFHTSVKHKQSPPYDIPVHRVDIENRSPLSDLLKADSIMVNSYHHQAIKTVSPKLSVMAKSEDGLIEAVYMPDKKFVWAAQWHPEYSLNDINSKRLFYKFVNSSKTGGLNG